ncbi:IS1 family transposase [Candidatus Cerribacteria bacterium 'Amazon FNV 2010 28 9']|uniref:IS1 family transposase n=1 Tax=Candidatus Cerribacteria bacterium 'Amazon FNV 2010 28 9' TaxID=2081795 RepID=A0A317JQ06_9BACT|nr:MAG: IS1 family transposase [Candidatus Cerribacteria bacterium 'Amazon FNV 2010 28 9']
MNVLSKEKQCQILSCLVEGNSIRATCRMTGTAKGTVTRLLVRVGKACSAYQDEVLVNLHCSRIECDEIWSFCYAKQKNLPEDLQGKEGYGTIWTWVALDSDSKLVISWFIGHRDEESAYTFMEDLEPRLKNKVQLSTDGLRAYENAVQGTFGKRVHYGMVEKQYGRIFFETEEHERRYSPHECIGMEKKKISGRPKKKFISTSFVERQNLTMRMSMRRFTRLTNGFSKKVENLEAAVALHFMYYNFCRPHQSLNPKRSLGITPAMVAGIADHQWMIEEIIKLMIDS